jgi:hypothetical protein
MVLARRLASAQGRSKEDGQTMSGGCGVELGMRSDGHASTIGAIRAARGIRGRSSFRRSALLVNVRPCRGLIAGDEANSQTGSPTGNIAF